MHVSVSGKNEGKTFSGTTFFLGDFFGEEEADLGVALSVSVSVGVSSGALRAHPRRRCAPRRGSRVSVFHWKKLKKRGARLLSRSRPRSGSVENKEKTKRNDSEYLVMDALVTAKKLGFKT